VNTPHYEAIGKKPPTKIFKILKKFLVNGGVVYIISKPPEVYGRLGCSPCFNSFKTKTHITMANAIEITGAQIFRLRVLESSRPYAKDSALAGQTYSRVTYNGTVFTINDKDPFLADLKNGKVHTAFLLETNDNITDADGNTSTVTRLAFDGYASNAQMIGMTNTEAVLQSIMKGSFKAEGELSEADLQALEQ
jgi:hypothetical protein